VTKIILITFYDSSYYTKIMLFYVPHKVQTYKSHENSYVLSRPTVFVFIILCEGTFVSIWIQFYKIKTVKQKIGTMRTYYIV